MNLLLFGAPGAGKGTQAILISNKYKLKQISTGNLLRDEITKKSELGNKIEKVINSGNLVSNEIVNKLVDNIVSDPVYSNKIIFDGYPRNLDQAKDLEILLNKYDQEIGAVIYLNVSKKTIKSRIENRIFCENCQKTFNKVYNPPNNKNHHCDKKYLTKRSDDNIDVILRRFDTYLELTNPVLEHYKKLLHFYEVNGDARIDEISNKINDILINIMN